jgi:hypothetical protein
MNTTTEVVKEVKPETHSVDSTQAGSHTPGPWTAHPPRGDNPDEDGDKYHWVVRAPGTNGEISFQLCQISSMNRREDGFDARLISAAPELLAALRELIAPFDGVAMIEGSITRGLGAISKATGETA